MDLKRELEIIEGTLNSILEIKDINGGDSWDFFICNIIRNDYQTDEDVPTFVEVRIDLPDFYMFMKQSIYWDGGVLSNTHRTKLDTKPDKHLEIRIDILNEYIDILKRRIDADS